MKNSDQNPTHPAPSREESCPVLLRPMQASDLDGGHRLSSLAGWNQRREDWQLFHKLNPAGAFVAWADNQVVGTVTTTNYQNQMGWIGMVLVDPAYRGRGIATRLLDSAIEALEQVNTVLLDATPDGRRVYLRLGFTDMFGLKRVIIENKNPPPLNHRDGLRPMQASDLDAIVEWDARLLGCNRRALLESLRHLAPEYAWVCEKEGRLTGFALGRRGSRFEYIGPLVAMNDDIASRLLNTLCHQMKGNLVAMDIPDLVSPWYESGRTPEMRVERPFTRMYRGQAPKLACPQGLYAIAGPEVG